MKRKFYRSCVSLLLSMVLIFGGVHIGAGANDGIAPAAVVVPPIISTLASVDIATPATLKIVVGNTLQLSCTTDPSGCPITWSSSNESVATVSSSGLVTGVSAGSTTITVKAYDPIVSSFYLTDSITITVCDSTGISNGTVYYIMNAGSDRLLGRQTSDYLSTTNIATVAFSSKDNAKWTVSEQSDGSFSLKNMDGSTGSLYLNTNGTDVTLAYGFKKFSIGRVTTGDYEGLYLIKYGNQYVAQNSNYDAYLSSTLSANCYWSFMEVGNDWARLYGFLYVRQVNGEDKTYDSRSAFNEIRPYLSSMGYPNTGYTNQSSTYAYTFLQSDDIFVYAGHGERGRITFCGAEDQETNSREITGEEITGEEIKGMILAHSNMGTNFQGTNYPNKYYINALLDNQLAGARCVLYLACLSGESYTNSNGTYNLVDETFNKGAHFVLGTTAKVSNIDVDPWMKAFFESALNGNSIEQCIADADDSLGERIYETDNGSKTCDGLPIYTRGDQSQYLYLGG